MKCANPVQAHTQTEAFHNAIELSRSNYSERQLQSKVEKIAKIIFNLAMRERRQRNLMRPMTVCRKDEINA